MCTACSTRRSFIAGGLAAAASLALPRSAASQTFPILCGWSGGPGYGTGLAPAAPQAVTEVQDVMRAIGFHAPMQVYRGGVENAAATVIGGGPAIVYNPYFLNALAGCNPVAARSVLAHEVGHHANQDTTFMASYRHPWSKELGADWVSGLAMRRLGVDLALAESGIVCSFGAFSPGSASHPDSMNRLSAIRAGWHAG